MSHRSNIWRTVVFVCLAALLLAALTPGAAGLPLMLLVVTACLFPGTALVVLLPCADEEPRAEQPLALAALLLDLLLQRSSSRLAVMPRPGFLKEKT
jgi:hypothetical protein